MNSQSELHNGTKTNTVVGVEGILCSRRTDVAHRGSPGGTFISCYYGSREPPCGPPNAHIIRSTPSSLSKTVGGAPPGPRMPRQEAVRSLCVGQCPAARAFLIYGLCPGQGPGGPVQVVSSLQSFPIPHLCIGGRRVAVLPIRQCVPILIIVIVRVRHVFGVRQTLPPYTGGAPGRGHCGAVLGVLFPGGRRRWVHLAENKNHLKKVKVVVLSLEVDAVFSKPFHLHKDGGSSRKIQSEVFLSHWARH